jgi:DNA-binding transcriptional regulator YhcF (GntR family)
VSGLIKLCYNLRMPLPTKYVAVADTIEADIRAGRLRPGDQIPSVRSWVRSGELAARTAQKVHRELRDRGLVSSRTGVGTVVRSDWGAAARTG